MGRETRGKVEANDDGESQKSQVGSRSTVTEESVRVRDRSGGLVDSSTKIVWGTGST